MINFTPQYVPNYIMPTQIPEGLLVQNYWSNLIDILGIGFLLKKNE
jgi:hypothetical protein